jgi:hypothetical protein
MTRSQQNKITLVIAVVYFAVMLTAGYVVMWNYYGAITVIKSE